MVQREEQTSDRSAKDSHTRTVNLLVSDLQDDLSIELSSIEPVVCAVLDLEGAKTDELSLCFVSTERICQLHKQFFDDDSPTDCISFPIDQAKEEEYHLLGEIFICPKTAIQYAETHGEELSKEITLYLVHGLLHLLGHDDGPNVEKMRQAEEKQMHNLSQLGLMLKTSRKKVLADLS